MDNSEVQMAIPSDANTLFRQTVEQAWMKLNKKQKFKSEQ